MTPDTVARDLKDLCNKMKQCYGAHIVRLRKALEALTALRSKDPRAAKVIDGAVSSSNNTRGLDLLNMDMIAPTQRLARYPLLLREAIKYTTELHRDRHLLEEALACFAHLCQAINDTKADEGCATIFGLLLFFMFCPL